MEEVLLQDIHEVTLATAVVVVMREAKLLLKGEFKLMSRTNILDSARGHPFLVSKTTKGHTPARSSSIYSGPMAF